MILNVLTPDKPAGLCYSPALTLQSLTGPDQNKLKIDALSCIHHPKYNNSTLEPILPPAIIVSPIQWSLDNQISKATGTEPDPPEGPEGEGLCNLIPTADPSGLWTPRKPANPLLLTTCYWWPSMAREVSQFVKNCSACAISKTPRHLPQGKLVPLPIPRRPWSQLGVNFVTDLPPSNSNTYFLVVVDRFSKACKLIPLNRLPTAFETAELLFQLVFRNIEIYKDIVSDHGPQLIFQGLASPLPTLRNFRESIICISSRNQWSD